MSTQTYIHPEDDFEVTSSRGGCEDLTPYVVVWITHANEGSTTRVFCDMKHLRMFASAIQEGIAILEAEQEGETDAT